MTWVRHQLHTSIADLLYVKASCWIADYVHICVAQLRATLIGSPTLHTFPTMATVISKSCFLFSSDSYGIADSARIACGGVPFARFCTHIFDRLPLDCRRSMLHTLTQCTVFWLQPARIIYIYMCVYALKHLENIEHQYLWIHRVSCHSISFFRSAWWLIHMLILVWQAGTSWWPAHFWHQGKLALGLIYVVLKRVCVNSLPTYIFFPDRSLLCSFEDRQMLSFSGVAKKTVCVFDIFVSTNMQRVPVIQVILSLASLSRFRRLGTIVALRFTVFHDLCIMQAVGFMSYSSTQSSYPSNLVVAWSFNSIL
jgi:hypothetical protein